MEITFTEHALEMLDKRKFLKDEVIEAIKFLGLACERDLADFSPQMNFTL